MNNSRRKFIKGIAAGSAFCAIGVAAWQLGLLDGTPSASHVGPCLREGVVLTSSQNGGQEALWQGEPVFTVNREGATLLALADGSRTLDEIISRTGSFRPDETADFFLNLARAGWLSERLEVYKVEIPT